MAMGAVVSHPRGAMHHFAGQRSRCERNATSGKECDFERQGELALVEPTDDEIQVDGGDQPGADVTARLLLALTALYVQRSNHTAEEQQQYTELALRLLDKTGPETRAAVATWLQRHPDAPAAVVARLDSVRFSHGVPDGAPSHSVQDQSAPTRQTAIPASAERPRAPLTPERAEAFFAAGPPERRWMLSDIAATDAAADAPGNGQRFHVRIDTAPWQGRTGAFARDFARLIDTPMSLGERILNDPSGEPLVVAARATGMPAAMLQRILLLVCPATNHSVQRVYELTELYHGLDGVTAHALLAAWRDAARPDGDAPLPPPAGPVTNMRARLGALNARMESRKA
jgi:hypothetical protein